MSALVARRSASRAARARPPARSDGFARREAARVHRFPLAHVLDGRMRRRNAVQDAGPVDPAVTENRRDTVEDLNRRISCIHRMYSSRCGRCAASGSRPRSAKLRRSHT